MKRSIFRVVLLQLVPRYLSFLWQAFTMCCVKMTTLIHFIDGKCRMKYGTALTQVYIRVQALYVLLASEPSIAFQVLVKHVCSLTTYSQVISITCEWNRSIHCFLESTSCVKCESCMQSNLVKSLYLAFVSLICFFSDRSTTIRIVTILFFLMLDDVH